jgi:hypothetical protein
MVNETVDGMVATEAQTGEIAFRVIGLITVDVVDMHGPLSMRDITQDTAALVFSPHVDTRIPIVIAQLLFAHVRQGRSVLSIDMSALFFLLKMSLGGFKMANMVFLTILRGTRREWGITGSTQPFTAACLGFHPLAFTQEF